MKFLVELQNSVNYGTFDPWDQNLEPWSYTNYFGATPRSLTPNLRNPNTSCSVTIFLHCNKHIGLRGLVAQPRTPNAKSLPEPHKGYGLRGYVAKSRTPDPKVPSRGLGFEVSVQNRESPGSNAYQEGLGFEASAQKREPQTHMPTLWDWASLIRCKIANPRLKFSPSGSELQGIVDSWH